MRAAIGIDIGGTNVCIGLTLELGEILHQSTLRVANYQNEQAFLGELGEIVNQFTAVSSDLEIEGIGVGSPGANVRTGTIEKASNLPWKKLEIVDHLKSITGLTVFLTNDANLFAIAEKVFGHARGMDDFIALTLGTGIGAGIYTSGNLLSGRDGLAGEVGHITYQRNGRPCKCGRHGCLERYASASGVVETTRQLLSEALLVSELSGVPTELLSAQMIADAASNDDPLALRVFQVTGEILGESLADLSAAFNPEALFVSGGLAKAGELLFNPMKKSFERSLLAIYPMDVPIMNSSIPDQDAGVLGASALVWEQIKNVNESSFTEI